MVDDGESTGYVWANPYGQIWQKGTGWDCDAEHDDDYAVRYWHPLPDVPTLAELDAHRDERASVAATAAASEGVGR